MWDNCLATKVVNGKTLALMRFIYTTALVYDLTDQGYSHRYCYPRYSDAVEAFETWDGGVPSGNWIKRKGRGGEVSNPHYVPDAPPDVPDAPPDVPDADNRGAR